MELIGINYNTLFMKTKTKQKTQQYAKYIHSRINTLNLSKS